MQPYDPNDSILLLFDPLSGPETPPRNTNSPDSTSSDKENDVSSQQPGQLTVFFNRIYKENPIYDAKSPNGKLIDFGEASFASHCGDEESPDENGAADENANVEPSPSVHRRPLADLDVERVASPTSTSPMERRLTPAVPRVSWADHVSLSPFAAPPSPSAEPTLDDVINEINLSAMSLSTQQVVREETAELSCPNIMVCPPEVEPPPSTPQVADKPDQTFSPEHLSPIMPMATSSATRRTHTSSNTSAQDPRRTSVDLQSTFSLHLQSSEMAFDLLNDKISFLNTSNSSSSLADADMVDDTFDLAKEQLAMEEIAARYMKSSAIDIEEDTFDFVKEQRRMEAGSQKYDSIREESLAEVVREMPRVKELTPPKPTPSISCTLESAEVSSPRPPVFSLPPMHMSKSSAEVEDKVEEASPDPASPALASSTAPPALPVAKKMFKLQHERVPSTSGSAISATTVTRRSSISRPATEARRGSISQPRPTTEARRSSISQPRPPVATSGSDAPRAPAPTVKAPIRRLSSASSATRPSLRALVKPSSTAVAVPSKPAPRTLPTASSTSGPKRPAPSTAASKSSVPAPASRLYRPTPPSATATPSAAQPKPALRQPSASSGAKSALPRPASRLPAPSRLPSGIARRL